MRAGVSIAINCSYRCHEIRGDVYMDTGTWIAIGKSKVWKVVTGTDSVSGDTVPGKGEFQINLSMETQEWTAFGINYSMKRRFLLHGGQM